MEKNIMEQITAETQKQMDSQVEQETTQAEKDLTLAKEALNAYFTTDVVVKDFSQIPVEIRLAFVQKTPPQFIKYRKVDSTDVPYIDHFYAEKALNFVSNFNWGSEKISSEITEKDVTTSKGKKTKMYEATVELKCWMFFPNGVRIERYVASGHNMYESPATTKADALQSAISKAHTKFARQLGIGTNIQEAEEKAYNRVSRYYVENKGTSPAEVVFDDILLDWEAKIEDISTQEELAKVGRELDELIKNDRLNENIKTAVEQAYKNKFNQLSK